ncbi:hypothetical protein COH21_006508 [Aspergillus flavus]|nr:hypothetical protein COH21_006508 [Aspergillus flavus]
MSYQQQPPYPPQPAVLLLDNTHLNPKWDTTHVSNNPHRRRRVTAVLVPAWPPFVAVSFAKRAANAVLTASNAAKCAKLHDPYMTSMIR